MSSCVPCRRGMVASSRPGERGPRPSAVAHREFRPRCQPATRPGSCQSGQALLLSLSWANPASCCRLCQWPAWVLRSRVRSETATRSMNHFRRSTFVFLNSLGGTPMCSTASSRSLPASIEEEAPELVPRRSRSRRERKWLGGPGGGGPSTAPPASLGTQLLRGLLAAPSLLQVQGGGGGGGSPRQSQGLHFQLGGAWALGSAAGQLPAGRARRDSESDPGSLAFAELRRTAAGWTWLPSFPSLRGLPG